MTGPAQKISPVAAAIVLGFGILIAPHLNLAFAQNEPEPETTPIEEPNAEPTDWTPVTAGEADRGGPAASQETTTSPASEHMPAESPTPLTAAEGPSPAATPVRGERAPGNSNAGSRRTTESMSPSSISNPSTNAPSSQAPTSQNAGKAPAAVPSNSPFVGINFGNQKGPTNIKSDTGTLDYQNKAVLFAGHVHAVQADGDLTSDTLKVQYGQTFNDIKMMYADGNVRMSQGTRWITSDHAVLDQTKHLLTFRGNPVAHDGQDQITGSTITVDLVTDKSTVENPRVVIFPRESKKPDNVDSPDSP